jgi:hypothetical protein
VLILLDRERLETPLPDMAAGIVVAMITPDMSIHQPSHPGAEVAIAERPEDQVKVIGHQAISQDPHGSKPASLIDQIDKRIVIGIFMEDPSPSIPPVEDMVAKVGQRGSFGAWHESEDWGFVGSSQGKSWMSPFRSKVGCPEWRELKR